MQFDYSKLMDEYNLVDFIVQHLLPGAALDDFVLEVIKWVIYIYDRGGKIKKKKETERVGERDSLKKKNIRRAGPMVRKTLYL